MKYKVAEQAALLIAARQLSHPGEVAPHRRRSDE